MPNPHSAGEQILGNDNPEGTSFGKDTNSKVGFHGSKSAQVEISTSAMTNAVAELLTLLSNKGLISFTGGTLTFGDITLGVNDKIGNDPEFGGLSFDEYNSGVFDSGLDIGGRLYITDGLSAPPTKAGKAALYIDSADGDFKIKFSDGTVKTIVLDT